jgi:GT2 family glycosyltransferase
MTPAVLILHFKNSPHTLACLDSLAAVSSPFAAYIISIQSTDAQSLRNHSVKPNVIDTDHNGGFAWANNRLMSQAFKDGHESVILLNNDTTVQPDFIPPLLKQLNRQGIGMACPKIYFYPGNEFHQDAYMPSERGKVIWYAGGIIDWANVYAAHWGVNEFDHGQFDEVIKTDFATGCCLGITKKTIEKIGFMDDKYFLYYEDADWSQRAKKVGLTIVVEPKSVIYHKNAGSTGGSGSAVQTRYQQRSRLRFGVKYAPLKTKFHLLKNALHDSFSA